MVAPFLPASAAAVPSLLTSDTFDPIAFLGDGVETAAGLLPKIGAGLGGLPALASSATSGAYQDIFNTSPFNVGSGQLDNTPSNSASTGLPSASQIWPIALGVVGLWIALAMIKR